MTKTREQLVDRMIAIYGFESPIVIEFAHICETHSENRLEDLFLETIVKSHEEYPVLEDDC